jgi:mRNA-degrading endonuclease YafQ of YafQ-DinJ toxin-antitoxin module
MAVKLLAEEKETIFKKDPFDVALSTHKLHGKLRAFHSFSINNKYRIIFEFVESNNIKFHYVGTHDIYD